MLRFQAPVQLYGLNFYTILRMCLYMCKVLNNIFLVNFNNLVSFLNCFNKLKVTLCSNLDLKIQRYTVFLDVNLVNFHFGPPVNCLSCHLLSWSLSHALILTLPAVHLKIEEIGRMLRTGDLGIPPNPGDRYNTCIVTLLV